MLVAPSTEVTGTILHLQRLSTEDGPGIRTTVFFKGCPLRCAWCHNPESLTLAPQVHWLENRCIGCLSCVEACPRGGIRAGLQGIERDWQICTGCGVCAQACPSGAMEQLGKTITVDALSRELLKDRAYFEKSGGGVTLSGGEPTLQPDFCLELATKLHQAGISVALDTCGLCSRAVLESLLPRVDVVLFDFKLFDAAEHRRWTGASNQRIIENLLWLRDRLAGGLPVRLWLRTPLIPAATFSPENIRAISAFLAAELDDTVQRWELCAFNNLCRDKYTRLGLEWAFATVPLLTRAELDAAGEWARVGGFDPARIFVTGAARTG